MSRKKAEAKRVQELIDAHKLARKRDKTSVHNKIEGHLASNGLDRGRAFGGKFNGKDARKAMENPHLVFDGLRGILKENKNTSYSESDIDVLVDQIIESMSKWNTFFSVL